MLSASSQQRRDLFRSKKLPRSARRWDLAFVLFARFFAVLGGVHDLDVEESTQLPERTVPSKAQGSGRLLSTVSDRMVDAHPLASLTDHCWRFLRRDHSQGLLIAMREIRSALCKSVRLRAQSSVSTPSSSRAASCTSGLRLEIRFTSITLLT